MDGAVRICEGVTPSPYARKCGRCSSQQLADGTVDAAGVLAFWRCFHWHATDTSSLAHYRHLPTAFILLCPCRATPSTSSVPSHAPQVAVARLGKACWRRNQAVAARITTTTRLACLNLRYLISSNRNEDGVGKSSCCTARDLPHTTCHRSSHSLDGHNGTAPSLILQAAVRCRRGCRPLPYPRRRGHRQEHWRHPRPARRGR